MRIATLQFAPKLGDVEGNITRANELLKRGKVIACDGSSERTEVGIDGLRPDLLVLPELALTGWWFHFFFFLFAFFSSLFSVFGFRFSP